MRGNLSEHDYRMDSNPVRCPFATLIELSHSAADVLAKMPGVDGSKIYPAGHSVGGTIALLSAMTSKRFRACSSFCSAPSCVACRYVVL